MSEMLSYREAAQRVRRSIRTINRWRKSGMRMEWEEREGQRVRVVDEGVLLAHWRDRLDANPAHQWRLRRAIADLTPPTAPAMTGDAKAGARD